MHPSIEWALAGRRVALVVVVLAAGCATTGAPGVTIGRPSVRGPAPAGHAAAERVVGRLRMHQPAIARCFDDLSLRRGGVAMAVSLALEQRGVQLYVTRVTARDAHTIVDRGVEQCLTEVIIPWRIDEANFALEVPLDVRARVFVTVAAQVPMRETWAPRERRGE